ncbi:hypothetical protein [Sulfoacidibacillus ferrooxidans]|uniref:Uncharacterized protein n=1 Tax=Sulfoacidibacillus ferrooxidans TaxID=2005001 RepID=A0A9X1V9Q2_9BACL|nr:hypothetical protein [Sulfoacidibacillus ferrooxidans]MCI0184236.1 hypothetical protein [Sulfoacidibacillus ferrooxidans]
MTINIQDRLLERLIQTGAIRVRKNENDMAFWYTSCIPGPYYINVEKIIGPHIASHLLPQITKILSSQMNNREKAMSISHMIIDQLNHDMNYLETISLLTEFYQSKTSLLPQAISGGERRDWFFSVPFAEIMGIPHLFLLKNGDYWCLDNNDHLTNQNWNDMNILHVSDIINTATSYTRYWLPTLKNVGVSLQETLTVVIRGLPGRQKLEQNGVRITTPLDLDEAVFVEACKKNLISQFTLSDILLYMESPRLWTHNFLNHCERLLIDQVAVMDETQQLRIQTFINNDLYEFAQDFPLLFSAHEQGGELNVCKDR